MSENNKPRVLCIIPNYVALGKESQNKWLINQLISSFKEFEPDAHLLFIDDASPAISRAYYYGFSYLINGSNISFGFEMLERNVGFGAAVNKGLFRAAQGAYDYVVLVNSDIELVGPFIDQMLDCMKTNKASIWGPRLLYPDGRIQSAGYEFSSLGQCTHYDRDSISCVNPGNSKTTRFVQGVTGAFMGIEMPTFPFEEEFFMAYEDVDYCLRAWNVGKSVIYDGSVDVIHHEGATRGIGMSETELKAKTLFANKLHSYKIPVSKIKILQSNKVLLRERFI